MPYFDRFDICDAYYLFAMLYHDGQGSHTYAFLGRLERMGYRPGATYHSERRLSENAQAIFDQLVEQWT